ncbi:hypothetical protein Tco_0688015 [Tanacetum coccineum]
MASQEIIHRETKDVKFNGAGWNNDMSGVGNGNRVTVANMNRWPETDGEQAQPREYLGCWRANCEDYVVVGPVAAVVGLYHIHAAGRPQKEPVGPAVELHHKKKGCVGCWAVRVGLADCIVLFLMDSIYICKQRLIGVVAKPLKI